MEGEQLCYNIISCIYGTLEPSLFEIYSTLVKKNCSISRIGCLLSLRRYDECLVMINEELELDDANPDLHVFRAKLYRLFGNV